MAKRWTATRGTGRAAIRPLGILEGYAEAARRLGVRFEFGVEVTGFVLEKRLPGRIARIETTAGPISARHVVNAAGAWAGVIARRAGVDLPVSPLRRQVAPTVPTTVLPEDMPMTIFLEDGFHLRVRDGRAHSLDVSSVRPSRFAEGAAIPEFHLL